MSIRHVYTPVKVTLQSHFDRGVYTYPDLYSYLQEALALIDYFHNEVITLKLVWLPNYLEY